MHPEAILIVGGGPAGIATALFLAHSAPELAERLVVLEKERFPREKFCAGAVGARADRLLGTIGVKLDVPSVPIAGVAFRAMGETAVVRDGRIGRVVRRLEFDHALAEEAKRRGISVREEVKVQTVRFRAGAVEVDTSGGTLRAAVVVGADGVGSVVRRALSLPPTPYVAQALEVDTEPVSADLERDLLLFDLSDRALQGYYWEFPTVVEGRELVCRGVYQVRRRGQPPGPEIQHILGRELEARGIVLSTCRRKRFSERGFARHVPVARPRVLLVGEAAGIDPVTGEGIAQAIQYGAAAGRYIARRIRERDLRFEDWSREIAAGRVGRDLIVRSSVTPHFYGPYRAGIERFLLGSPAFIRVGLQHFAGKRWVRRDVIRGATSAIVALGRGVLDPGPSAASFRPDSGRIASSA